MLNQFSRTELLFGKEAMERGLRSLESAGLEVMSAKHWSAAASRNLIW